MAFERNQMGFKIGAPVTDLGKKLLLAYGLLYITELILVHWFNIPVARIFQLHPFENPNFHAWQFFTHPFIQNPNSPVDFLISCLLFYFFAGSVERTIGTKRFLSLFYIAAYGGGLLGLCFSNVAGFELPFYGMMPSLLAILVVFGLLSPEATILLMFILPVKAKYISYGTILVVFLSFLAKSNPAATYQLGGIFIGFLYYNGFRQTFETNKLYLNYLYWQQKRKRSKFKVIDGQKDDNDKPTYH